MTEHDLLEKLRHSAENVQVPDSLAPSRLCPTLDRQPNKHTLRRHSFTRLSSAAAVILFCFVLSGAAYRYSQTSPPANFDSQENEMILEKETEHQHSQRQARTVPDKKHNAGSLYTVAESYQQVYDSLEPYSVKRERDVSSVTEGVNSEESLNSPMTKLQSSDASDMAAKSSYSKTNLQTEGVDESDIVKTDGRYIYTVNEQKIRITDTAYGELKDAGTITPPLNPSDSILELYVDQQVLQILVQHYTAVLENYQHETEGTQDSTDSEDGVIREPNTGFIQVEDYIVSKTVETRYETTLYTYDITDPSRPVLSGSSTQEGTYKTSRKIGDIIYLFTEQRMSSFTNYKSSEGGIIPCVNGEKIPCDHIYLPERGSRGMIVTSIDQHDPDNIMDSVMIVNDDADVYVGLDSIYLYFSEYQNNQSLTSIAKFSICNGTIDAVDSTSVKGNVTDTFAIHEYNGTLRVLTTSWDDNGSTNNYLYLFDASLKLTGSIEDIAKGEEIYAARYLNDTAYFITYHNTDPLFAADLSDQNHPVLIGQIEISGFSEYLHIWNDNQLLGIGYETDPVTGEQKGLKIVMFDITDPTDLKIAGSLTLEEYNHTPALYEYKCVFPDLQNNLIGFAADCRAEENQSDYLVCAWENGQFVKKLRYRLPQSVYSDSVRGLSIGTKFYIVGNSEIVSFDMRNHWKQLSQITL